MATLRSRYELQKKRLLDSPAAKTFRIYWRLYGGIRALLQSPYIYFALFFTIATNKFWLQVEGSNRPWAQTAIDTIPSMLGFSMGGMAIMLAFSNASIFSALTQRGQPDSFFLKVVANFFHFILVQTISILLAVACKAYPNDWISAIGYFSFCYALLVGVATAGQLLRTAQVFNAGGSLGSDVPPDRTPSKD